MPNQMITPFEIHEAALDAVKVSELYLKAYVNDYTPDSDMSAGSFSEAAGGGYAHISVHPSDWTEEYSNDPRDIILAEQTWTFSGVLTASATIYGYYLITQDLNYVRAAKRLDSVYQPASGGGTLKVTPRVQAGNGTPA